WRCRLSRGFAEETIHRLVEALAVAEFFLCCQNDEPELRHRTPLGLQIDRFDEHQRTSNRYHQQGPTNHTRSLLIPKRKLPRQLCVLIDACLNLNWSIDHP